jgi:hypothetical protein
MNAAPQTRAAKQMKQRGKRWFNRASGVSEALQKDNL